MYKITFDIWLALLLFLLLAIVFLGSILLRVRRTLVLLQLEVFIRELPAAGDLQGNCQIDGGHGDFFAAGRQRR